MPAILIVVLVVIVALLLLGALAGLALQLLWFVIVGLVIGALARLVVPGTEGMSLLATALYGIGGALLGGIVANLLGVGRILEFVIAILVAAALIVALGRGTGRRRALA
jgi:uncharacterized membrane protein YeaQ/YmgE (transglycosylase-associated protein family)